MTRASERELAATLATLAVVYEFPECEAHAPWPSGAARTASCSPVGSAAAGNARTARSHAGGHRTRRQRGSRTRPRTGPGPNPRGAGDPHALTRTAGRQVGQIRGRQRSVLLTATVQVLWPPPFRLACPLTRFFDLAENALGHWSAHARRVKI